MCMKIINSRFLGLGVFLLLAPLLYAQNNYRPGFIITLQKDTVYGDILGYRFTDDGRFYVSKFIELQYNAPSEDLRDTLLKTRFVNAWSGVVGYTF